MYHPLAPDFQPQPPPKILFRLCREQYDIYIRKFAVLIGLYSVAKIDILIYTKTISIADDAIFSAWWPRIGDQPFVRSAQDTRIRDSLIRYFYRCIATSIAGRGMCQEWCTSQDLFYLYCLLTGRPCTLARCLMKYFATYYHRHERGVFDGVYVTRIACVHGLIDIEPADMDAIHSCD
ncbi:hypothetical protein R6Q57_024466 [Mikania cordata]